MKKTETILGAAMFVMMIVTLYLIFIWVPTEKTMGIIQRIFYFHVPSAWASFVCYAFVFGFSLAYLKSRSPKWDNLAAAAAEVGTLFCTVVLITGPIWAKPVWGIWWTWDARLTTTFVLWLIFVGYLMLRLYVIDPNKRSNLCAVFGIIGFLNVPIVYMSIRWWRTQHPSPVMGGGSDSGLAPEMLLTFLVSLGTFTLLSAYLIMKRYRLSQLESEVTALFKHLQSKRA